MSLSTDVVPLWVNPFGPGAINNLLFFSIDTNATISCQNAGSRCSFVDTFFDEMQGSGSSAISAQEMAFIWAVVDPTSAELYLGGCKLNDVCYAVCFEDCECLLSDGVTPCAQSTSTPDLNCTIELGNGELQGEVFECPEFYGNRTTVKPPISDTTLAFNGTDFSCQENIFVTPKELICSLQSRVTAPNGDYADMKIQVTCDPNDDNFLHSDSNCKCEILVTDGIPGQAATSSKCTCDLCWDGNGVIPVVVDCGDDDLVADCSSIDCNGSCNGSCMPDCTLSGSDCPLPCNSNSTTTVTPTMKPIGNNWTDTNITETWTPTANPTMMPNSTTNGTEVPPVTAPPNVTFPEGNETTIPPIVPTLAPNATTPDMNVTTPDTNATLSPNATIPDVNETMAPTASPSVIPANGTMAPTLSPTDAASNGTLPGPNETLAPTTSSTAAPTMLNETNAPTLGSNETYAPTLSPTLVSNDTQSAPNETAAPSATPGNSSDATPPLIDESDTEPPTSEPTKIPVQDGSTATPSSSTTQAPVSTPTTDTQTRSFTGISMRLAGTGVTTLDAAARAAFESATEEFYRRRFASSTGSSSAQRRLQDITPFDTDVTVTGEQPDNTGIRVMYDQVLYFTSTGQNVDDPTVRDALLSPLSTVGGKQEYLAFLRDSSQAFEGVTSVDSPALPDSDRSASSSNNEDSGGVSSVVLIMVIVFASLCFCFCVCGCIGFFLFGKTGGGGKRPGPEDGSGVMGGADDDYGGGYDMYDTPAIAPNREERDTFVDEAGVNPTLQEWGSSGPNEGAIDEFSTMGPSETTMSNDYGGGDLFGADDDSRRRDEGLEFGGGGFRQDGLEFGNDSRLRDEGLEFGDGAADADADASECTSGYDDGDEETSGLRSSSASESGSGSYSGSESGEESGSESGSGSGEDEESGSEKGEYSNGDADDWGLA